MNKYREQFRPKNYVENINQVENYDPKFEYKNVITTYRHDPGRVLRYMDAGWEVVETTDNLVDDRSNSPKEKKKIRPQASISTTKDGHEQVLMRILKTKRAENELAKKNKRKLAQTQQAQRRGEQITEEGDNVKIVAPEVNETNME